ncbi:hypothetical protein KKH23_05950 [Patescibacteria group bacterium]|nr:hypothetical protein [Patescibacteria group bacterium]
MNYIKRLEKENKEMAGILAEIESYLLTDKFMWPDDYVNVKDILNRVQPNWQLYRGKGD